MSIKEYIEGQTVTIVIKTWEKGKESDVKGVILESNENEVVFKPITHDSISSKYKTTYDIHNVCSYQIKDIVSVQSHEFPNEVKSHIEKYYKKYTEQKELRNQIERLQNQIQQINEHIEDIEIEKKEICECAYASYFPHAKGLEINFLTRYFRNELEKMWNELKEKKQKNNETIHFLKPHVINKGESVVVTFQLEKKHDYIEDVPSCLYNNCRCHSEAAEDVFFEKYSHPFSLNSLKRFDITHRDSIACDYKYENVMYAFNEVTAYYIINKFEIHTNPQKVKPERILELLSEFLIAYA